MVGALKNYIGTLNDFDMFEESTGDILQFFSLSFFNKILD